MLLSPPFGMAANVNKGQNHDGALVDPENNVIREGCDEMTPRPIGSKPNGFGVALNGAERIGERAHEALSDDARDSCVLMCDLVDLFTRRLSEAKRAHQPNR